MPASVSLSVGWSQALTVRALLVNCSGAQCQFCSASRWVVAGIKFLSLYACCTSEVPLILHPF